MAGAKSVKAWAGQHTILQGDVAEVCGGLPDEYFDGCLCDPPYGLSFMGKKWDYDVPSVEAWAAVLATMKPGAHLLAFAGTRTQHRMAVRIEDAGFEIRDMIAWVYGCLDEATEVATEFGIMPYHKTKVGDRVLCYDAAHGEYTYQPILEVVEYDYSDTAYRLVGDFGEQVVSRNHRVIVERGGREVFQLAETLECEARVPVLENLPTLRQAIRDAHQGAGRPQQGVQCDLRECVDRCSECRDAAAGATQGCDDQVRGLRDECVEAGCVAAQGGDADMQQEVQRRTARCGVGEACTHGAGALVGRVGDGAEGAHDGRVQPGLEGRADVSKPEGGLRGAADQVRSMPCGPDEYGAQGRVFDGAQACGGAGTRPTADASGVCASHQPRCDGQPGGELDAVRHERTAQGIRAWCGHRSAVVRVVPFHYTGKVWCLRVPTGAFVAVRNGVAFPTGNSGFPKSLDVSKALDGVLGKQGKGFNAAGGKEKFDKQDLSKRSDYGYKYEPATEAARQWQGYGTALKPALEPITVARKPLRGTVAANCLEYGTGAINIDAGRVGSNPGYKYRADANGTTFHGQQGERIKQTAKKKGAEFIESTKGRWPANLIHDGSEEVLVGFPEAGGGFGISAGDPAGTGIYGSGFPRGDRRTVGFGDSGSAARFFYCAKVNPKERDGLKHPTMKPLALAEYLARLILPPKLSAPRRLLVPFCGVGSEIIGALRAGWDEVWGIEMSQEYVDLAESRIVRLASKTGVK